jgi:hypothetical protein
LRKDAGFTYFEKKNNFRSGKLVYSTLTKLYWEKGAQFT